MSLTWVHVVLAMRQGDGLNIAVAALWARQRDEMLRRVDVVETAIRALLEGRLLPAQREAAGAPPPRSAQPGVDVLLVGGERLPIRELQADLAARGLRVAAASASDDIALRLNAQVAVVDLSDPLAERFLSALKERRQEIVIGVADEAGLEARVAFARRGGRILLSADLAPHEIAEVVMSMRERFREERTHVLVVGDDAALLERTITLLRAHDLDVTTLQDPSHFWQTLERHNPDVLLLDLEMPGFNGLELCQAVRADPRWSQLPVLFLTAQREAESVRAVFAAGADDYLNKPVVEEELVQRIRNRLARIRLLRDLADRDALTGVANRRKASEQLARLERIAKRYGQPLTLAVLDLDHFKHVNNSFGHDAGDEVLRRLGRRLQGEFRGEDVVGRWGGEEFVIGMYGMPGPIAVDRLRALLDDWQREQFEDRSGGKFGTSFTIGLAELPASAGSLEELHRAADRARYRGKAAGGSRVEATGERGPTDVEHIDVAVVESDSALADLLTQPLSSQGWKFRVLGSGPTAVGALASEPPLFEARVVLLDRDLPGCDGLTVLRRLRARGVLARTRVVMLTSRGTESEVLKALEVGATDYVAKPFSVAVLLEKLRRLVT
jgi:diguanylate cyclase (GGDEF)-like protein